MFFWVFFIFFAILSTQIANPFFWFRIVASIKNYSKDMKKYRSDPEYGSRKPHYINYLENEEIGSIKTAINGNISIFVIAFLLFCLLYFTSARTWISLISAGWLIAIFNAFSAYMTFADARAFRKIEYLQAFSYAIVLGVISISLLLHGVIYNNIHHINSTSLVEPEVDIISVDTLNTLRETVLIQGYTIEKPINRNGQVIFPLSREDRRNLSIIGYVKLDKENGAPIIIKKELHYTPYQSGFQNLDIVSRQHLPKKQFWGEWSFQIKPSNGENDDEVYFAKMYGDYASLKGGRIVEGIYLINASTGKSETYSLDEIPEWVTGISE